MSSGIPTLTLLSDEQKFNGENLLKWNININQLLGSKGLLGYVNGTIPKPTQSPTSTPDPTPVYSTNPNVDEWSFRDQLARGHIMLNCTDVAGLGVLTTGTAKEAWDSIQKEWGTSTDMRKSHAQEVLNQTVYAEDSDIQEHIKLLRTRKAVVDTLNAKAMDVDTWKGIIIRSIPPTTKWLPVIPSLYAMSSAADIFSTLIAHGMILDRGTRTKPTSGSSSTALVVKSFASCTNPNCKAKKRSTHTTENCYWPGGGKEGQFSPNFGQRAKANIASSNQSDVEHFVLFANAFDTEGNSGIVLDGDEPGEHEDYSLALVSRSFESLGKGKIPTFMDSGASDTMFVSRADFGIYKTVTPRSGDSAKAIDGGFDIVGEGTVTKHYLVDGLEKKLSYTRAIHTPTLNANLISVSCFDKAGLTVTFGGGRGVVQKKDGTVVLTAKCEKGMYIVDEVDEDVPGVFGAVASLAHSVSLEQWHRRLTHCSPSTIVEMAKGSLVDGLQVSGNELRGKCEDCILRRQTRRAFDGMTEKGLNPLELVSFDLWGPSRVQSAGGKVYFMPIVDAGTSYKYAAYLSDKSDVSTIAAFDVFRIESESVSEYKIRRLRTDRAYESSAWHDYCQRHGIIHEFTAPYSSAQNGLAERAIRTTMDDVRTLLHDSGLPHLYWAEAAAYSVATRNLIPSRRYPGKIPAESFTGKRQDMSHLRVFGARCWAKIPTVNGAQVTGGSKLDPRGVACRLLGYSSGRGNYKLQDIDTRRVFVSRDVIFEEGHPHRTSSSVGENLPLFDTTLGETPLDDGETTNDGERKDQNNEASKQTDHITDHLDHDNRDDHSVDNPTEPNRDIPMESIQQTPELRHSSRISQPSGSILQSREYQQREDDGRRIGEDWTTSRTLPRSKATLTLDRLSFELDDYIACLTDTKASHNIPQSYRHAMTTDPDRWIVPMQIEMNTLKAKHTWDLVKPPQGANIMDSMWVYDIKWDGEGNRIKDKARLVGKGYTQQLGVDYNETWAGVVHVTGSPWVYLGPPGPNPHKTHTRSHGSGFHVSWVWVPVTSHHITSHHITHRPPLPSNHHPRQLQETPKTPPLHPQQHDGTTVEG